MAVIHQPNSYNKKNIHPPHFILSHLLSELHFHRTCAAVTADVCLKSGHTFRNGSVLNDLHQREALQEAAEHSEI